MEVKSEVSVRDLEISIEEDSKFLALKEELADFRTKQIADQKQTTERLSKLTEHVHSLQKYIDKPHHRLDLPSFSNMEFETLQKTVEELKTTLTALNHKIENTEIQTRKMLEGLALAVHHKIDHP